MGTAETSGGAEVCCAINRAEHPAPTGGFRECDGVWQRQPDPGEGSELPRRPPVELLA